MRILIDTNVLLDHALCRTPFFDEADRVLEVCARSENEALVAFHSLSNIYYVINRAHNQSVARKYLSDLAVWIKLGPTNLNQVVEALQLTGDLEDDLQWLAARDGRADIIVTRDVNGFKNSTVSVDSPSEFLAKNE